MPTEKVLTTEDELSAIFADLPPSDSPDAAEPPFDLEQWKADKQAEREGVFAMTDKMAQQVAADPAVFQQYLDTQSHFTRYTAANTLLVMAQRPGATHLGDLDYWKSQHIYIKRDELTNPVLIITPGERFTRPDQTIGTFYHIKRVYDISQAERVIAPRVKGYTDNAIIKALKVASPVPITVVPSLHDNRVAVYDQAANRIQLRIDGVPAGEIIRALSMETAMAALCAKDDPPPNARFKAYAASYAICKKYNVVGSGYNFDQAASLFTGMNPQEARAQLSEIRNATAFITGRMQGDLDKGRSNRDDRG